MHKSFVNPLGRWFYLYFGLLLCALVLGLAGVGWRAKALVDFSELYVSLALEILFVRLTWLLTRLKVPPLPGESRRMFRLRCLVKNALIPLIVLFIICLVGWFQYRVLRDFWLS